MLLSGNTLILLIVDLKASTMKNKLITPSNNNGHKQNTTELIVEGVFKFSNILTLQQKINELACTSEVKVRYVLDDVVNFEIVCNSSNSLNSELQNLKEFNFSILEQEDRYIKVRYNMLD